MCQAGDRVLSSFYDSELCPKSGFVQRQERQYRKQRRRLGQDYYWLESGLLLARWLAWLIDWPDWEDWDRWLLSLFWFAWNVFNRLGTGLDRPDFQLDMGVKQSQSNNHGTRLAYGRLCRQPMWPYPEKVVGPARLCRGCQAWLKGNPCLKKKWSSNSTWWKIYSSAGMGANPFKSSRVWWGPIAFMVFFQPPKGSQGPIFFGLPKRV